MRRLIGHRGRSPLVEVWRKVAGELGGEVALTKRGKPKRLCVPHGTWTIVTDIHTESHGESSSTYTRVRALFVRATSFRLRVTRRNPFHVFAPLVGFGGISTGHQRLDRTLFVRSDRPQIARAALRGTSLGQALLRDPKVKLVVTKPGRRIRKVAGDRVGEVQLRKSGKVREVATLRQLIETCAETLDELERRGVAREERVDEVEL